MEHFCYLIFFIISILIIVSLFIPHIHKAIEEVIRHVIRFSCHVRRDFTQISLFIIGILIHFLFNTLRFAVIIAKRNSVHAVINIPDIISITISNFFQISVPRLVLIINYLRSGYRCRYSISKCIIIKTIAETIVFNRCHSIFVVSISIDYLLLHSIMNHFL